MMKKQEQSTTIIALDLSLNSTGYAVLRATSKEGEAPQLIEKGFIKQTASHSHHKKLTKIEDVLNRLSRSYPDAVIVKEQLLFSPPRSAAVLAKVHGVTDLVFPEVHEYYPSTIKKDIAGNGKASKQELADAVYKHLELTEDELVFETDDESDAVAVALTHLFSSD